MAEKQVHTKVSEEIICKAATEAALKVPGVNHLEDSLADNIGKMISGKDGIPKGVRFSKEKGEAFSVDLFVIADYGVKIPQLAWDIQNQVKEALTELTNHKISAVNIHVQGVAMPHGIAEN